MRSDVFDLLPFVEDDGFLIDHLYSFDFGGKSFDRAIDFGKDEVVFDHVIKSDSEELVGIIFFRRRCRVRCSLRLKRR